LTSDIHIVNYFAVVRAASVKGNINLMKYFLNQTAAALAGRVIERLRDMMSAGADT
jgi:hypothetical protein